MIHYLTFTGIVIRFEVGVLLVILLALEWLVYKNIRPTTLILQGLVSGLPSLAFTLLVDSYFWQRWVWPEGSVFYFNAILNKSSEWGTLPFYAYFLSFLPRVLMISYPLALIGYCSDPRLRRLLHPALIYTALFSLQPHKEWRFIVYTFPLYTAAAASVMATLSHKGSFYATVCLVAIVAGGLVSFLLSIVTLLISMQNYPGGVALAALNATPLPYASVHIDVLTAMTGASRFSQVNSAWSYHKNETHRSIEDYLEAEYTHLITATPSANTSFEIIRTTHGFDSLQRKSIALYSQQLMSLMTSPWHWQSLLPFDIVLTPKLYTLQLVSPYQQWVRYRLQKHPVLIYSKSYCPYCKRAKQILDKYCPQKYHVIELDQREDGRALQTAVAQLTQHRTVPAIFVNGKLLGGSDALATLDRDNALQTLALACEPS
ncbi:Alg9-like mannosyltransferase family-domain-containing protein [Spinellus fusiger]|nr:Alg9-like mannosyltransferase family-domain-containing protein [Spinellus fusiger]